MQTRFNYSAQSVGHKLYRGRIIPARIDDVYEKVKENGSAFPIPALVVTYSPPNDAFEIQHYEGGKDCIPKGSDLGKFIEVFASLGIEDIDAGNMSFAPLRGKYVWLEVAPMRTPTGLEYKRFPKRWMTDDEVQEEFGLLQPLSKLIPHAGLIEAKLEGSTRAGILASLMPTKEIKPMITEVENAITQGIFAQWVEEHTNLHIVSENGEEVFRRRDGDNI